MHRDTKWARGLLELQQADGSWGWFHTLSAKQNSPVTTEQALRRLERLGYTIEDACIVRAVEYMDDCLRRREIPDRRERHRDWDVFLELILATGIRRFTDGNPRANRVARQWTDVLTAAFAGGGYDHAAYVAAYRDMWGMKPQCGRLVDFVSYYQLSLLHGRLDERTEAAFVDYVIHHADGIYYVYENSLDRLPQIFESRQASRYLAAVELLAEYGQAKPKLQFVAEWLNARRNENGKWDMGSGAKDGVYFPLSDDWRRRAVREADCTERIGGLLERLRMEDKTDVEGFHSGD